MPTCKRFTLYPRAPFRLDFTVWALRRRPSNAVDRWDGRTWRRTLVLDGAPVGIAVEQEGDTLRVEAEGGSRDAVAAAVERMLGIGIDLRPFYEMAARHPRLHRLAERFRGMKPPRFPSVFEALTNAITCQQISLEAGMAVMNRLAAAHGIAGAFPRPAAVAALEPAALRALGFSMSKAAALIEAAAAGDCLDNLAALPDAAALETLLAMRGVGRWTAEYVLLRGLGRLHVFPGDDIGARRHLERWLGSRRPLDYEGVRTTLRKWAPWAGLLYFHMLLDGLAASGRVPE